MGLRFSFRLGLGLRLWRSRGLHRRGSRGLFADVQKLAIFGILAFAILEELAVRNVVEFAVLPKFANTLDVVPAGLSILLSGR